MANVPNNRAPIRKTVFSFCITVQDSLNSIVKVISGSDVCWNSRLDDPAHVGSRNQALDGPVIHARERPGNWLIAFRR